MGSRTTTLLGLHLLLVLYSCSGIFSKLASGVEFLSLRFCLYYAVILAILFIYAIGWQQALKRMPLTSAFANKAITVFWGIVWGLVVFGESITLPKIVGAAFIISGVILFAIADGELHKQDQAEAGQDGDA
ncbi:transporter [Slackia heliotrinireducens]|uniref:transporter n=1 Tax=Slackia heliotrinireducens TaxID=84110 RepID=UPI00331486C4